MTAATGNGTREDPWVLRTPPGTSEYQMYRDESADPPALVCVVGKTTLSYQLRCIEDLHAMLVAHGDWIALGSADEQKPAAEGTVEAWARSDSNPVGGFYGLKKGLRGRFGMYVPPLMEALGLADVEHNPRNNRMRAAISVLWLGSSPTYSVQAACAAGRSSLSARRSRSARVNFHSKWGGDLLVAAAEREELPFER